MQTKPLRRTPNNFSIISISVKYMQMPTDPVVQLAFSSMDKRKSELSIGF